MSIIDLAIPLDGQPSYLDVLRADVPFRFVYVPSLGRVSLASPATWFGANGSGLLGRTGPSGSAVYSSGATNAERWTGIETGSDFTIIALVLDSSGRGSNRSPIDADNNSTVGRNWQFRLGTTNRLEFFVFNTSISVFGTGPTAVTSATDPSVLVGRVANGVVNSWLNGIGGTPTTITGTQQTLTAAELLGVGGRVDSGGAVSQFFGGNIYGLFVVAGALPDGLIQSFVSPDKVWAWAFEPREIQVFVPASGGANNTLTGDSGSYTYTGNAAAFQVTRALDGAVGSYTLTGNTGTFSYIPGAGSVPYTLSGATGAYAYTGNAATFRVSHTLSGATGAYAYSGNAATFKVGHALPGAAGAYAFTGRDGTFAYVGSTAYALSGDSGSYSLTGTEGAFAFSGAAKPAGGYDEARKKKRFVVKVGDKLVEYGSASAAAKALNKAPEAKPEPVAEDEPDADAPSPFAALTAWLLGGAGGQEQL